MQWTTPEAVRDWLALKPAADGTAEARRLARCVAAANVVVSRYVPEPPEGSEAPEDAGLAATMLAARLERRRNSPDGVQAITDQGALYVARTDPDIARLLRIEAYAPPAVG